MEKKVILITGTSRGIGQVTAGLLADLGYSVFGTVRKPSSSSVDVNYETLPLDVTSDESVESCVSSIIRRTGRIDVLINNAAVGLLGAIEETSIAEARALFEANFFGTARMVNAVLPSMRQRRTGLIINFGSLAAILPIPFHAYLSASKAAVITYSEALRLELKSFNIGVCVVEPGMVATHSGEAFEQLKVKRTIADYVELEQRAFVRIEAGQRTGNDPQTVARSVLRVIRSKSPARYYLVGKERWYARLSRWLPPSMTESLVTRHFRLS